MHYKTLLKISLTLKAFPMICGKALPNQKVAFKKISNDMVKAELIGFMLKIQGVYT